MPIKKTDIKRGNNMLVKPTDIKIVREKLEAKLGKEGLQNCLLSSYERRFKSKGISLQEAEEEILRGYYKVIYS